MTKRRSRGDGGLHWDEKRQRWIATATIGYNAKGKRITRKASGRTKTEAKDKLKEILRDLDDGLAIAPHGYTVTEAVTTWLKYGLRGRDPETVKNYRYQVEGHIIPNLGARKLRELSADEVDEFFTELSLTLSTRTLRLIYSILNRSVRMAQARDKVKRNVVALCDVPPGQDGRPSKALTLEQVEAVLDASESTPMHAYIVLSLLIGARTEELRALVWDEVDLIGKPDAEPVVLPSISVLRSVRRDGDTKTSKSRRTLAMPTRCVDALKAHCVHQDARRKLAGNRWQEHGLVFASEVGTPLDSHNVRRAFRRVLKAAGLDPKDWTPREMRHSFVSVLSASGVRIEDIARLVGHSGTAVTETVYRHQIVPVMVEAATAMDDIFPTDRTDKRLAAWRSLTEEQQEAMRVLARTMPERFAALVPDEGDSDPGPGAESEPGAA
ncbi:site-specific integrase [Actinokineospora iranica]|uniref:Site-specific recombinase XerD n=1 Tax=Actinokineospora iranica TaxID=1271860 RepID=A0A1G6WQA9_9PSEU|nr:site-specific integrase [Actinokineospora iranica]SDD68001.1 Site-specific recombinase XerD [Actinokineospora iranica]